MSPILNSVDIDQLELFRIIFFVLFCAATIGVIRGVYLEKEEFDAATRKKGWRLLIVSLAAELFFSALIFSTDSWVSSLQRSEILRLTTPRNLTPEQVARVAAKVCPFGGKQFDIVFVTFDEILFGNELQKIWTLCKWESKGVENRDVAIAAASGVVGIHFLYDLGHADEFKAAAEAFASALRDENIKAEAGPIPKDTPLATSMIHIQLGRRP